MYAALRGELDLGPITQPGRMSPSQLCFALKVLTFEQKQLDRICKRPTRRGRSSRAEGDAENR